jgi:hypothetical protein
MTIWGLAGVLGVSAAMLVGCSASSEDAARFREAVPQGDDVALRVPGGAAATGTTTQGLRIQSPGAATGPSSDAKFYAFTRDLTRDVDRTTAGILGAVWALVSTPPTTLEDKRAVWGPGSSSALEPNEWRLVVTEVGAGEYTYAFEGRPKAGGDFRGVLTGKGFAVSHPSHKAGSFEVDHEVYRALEPTAAKPQDEGRTKVTFDLAKAPATIAVELRPGAAKGWIDVQVAREPAGAGRVDIRALTNVDGSASTQLEDVTIASRWDASGAGRADVVMEKGDFASLSLKATECWSASFSRVYYEDTVGSEAKIGDASACVVAAK